MDGGAWRTTRGHKESGMTEHIRARGHLAILQSEQATRENPSGHQPAWFLSLSPRAPAAGEPFTGGLFPGSWKAAGAGPWGGQGWRSSTLALRREVPCALAELSSQERGRHPGCPHVGCSEPGPPVPPEHLKMGQEVVLVLCGEPSRPHTTPLPALTMGLAGHSRVSPELSVPAPGSTAQGSGLPPSKPNPPSKGGSLICLNPPTPRHQGRLGLPSSPPTQPSVSPCPPPPPPGSWQKVLAASSLSIGCLDGSLMSGLTCLKLGCGQMGDACTHARRDTHTLKELGAGGEQTLGLVPTRSGFQPGGAADNLQSRGDGQEASGESR